MKRRRFITFGSILAILLTAVAVAYTLGIACWSKSDRNLFGPKTPLWTGPSSPWILGSLRVGAIDVQFVEMEEFLVMSWTAIEACTKCSKRHENHLDCDGVLLSGSQGTSFHSIGPVLIGKSVYGRQSTYSIRAAYWLLPLAAAAYPAIYFLIAGIRRFRRRPGHCLHCDYDLTGNESGVCPECGTDIEMFIVHPGDASEH